MPDIVLTIKGRDDAARAFAQLGKYLRGAEKDLGAFKNKATGVNQTMRNTTAGVARLGIGMSQFFASFRVMGGGMSGLVAGMTTMGAGIKNLSRGLLQVTTGSVAASAAVTGVVAPLLAVAGAGAAATAVFIGLAKSSIAIGASLEQTEISLATFLGSTNKAREAMKLFRDFATQTPFELPEVIAGGRQLLAFGFSLKEVEGVLRDAGNAAAGTGANVLDLTRAFGRLKSGDFGEALERFRDFGINLRALRPELFTKAGSFTGTAKEAVEAVRKVIQEGSGEFKGFNGLMEKQAASFNGIMSMLSDAWFNFRAAISDSGVFRAAKEGFRGILTEIERLQSKGKLDEWANTIGGSVLILIDSLKLLAPSGGTIESVIDGFVKFGSISVQVFARAVEALSIVTDAVGIFVGAFVGSWDTIKSNGVAPFLSALLTAFGRTTSVILSELTAGFVVLLLVDLPKMAWAAFKLLIKVFTSVAYWTQLWDNVVTLFFQWLIRPMHVAWIALLERFSAALSYFGVNVTAELDDAKRKVEEIDKLEFKILDLTQIEGASQDIDDLKEALAGAGTTIGGAFVDAGADIMGVLSQLSAEVGLDTDLGVKLGALSTRMGDLFRPFEDAATRAKGAPGAIEEETKKAVEKMIPWWQKLADEIKGGIDQGVKEYAKSLGTLTKNVADETKKILGDLEKSLASGLKTLFFGREDQKALEKAADKLKSLRSLLGADSETGIQLDVFGESEAATSAEIARIQGIFDSATQGLSGGLSAQAGAVRDQILGLADPRATQESVDAAREALNDLIDKIEAQTGFMGRLRGFGSQMQDMVVEGFQTSLTDLLAAELMRGFVGMFIGGSAEEATAKAAGQRASGAVKEGVGELGLAEKVKTELGSVAGSIKDFDSDNAGKIVGAIKSGSGTLGNLETDVGSTIGSIAGKIKDFDSDNAGKIVGAIKSGSGTLGNLVTDAASVFTGVGTKITDFTTAHGGKAAGAIKEGFDTLDLGGKLRSAVDLVDSASLFGGGDSGLAGKLHGAFKTAWGGSSFAFIADKIGDAIDAIPTVLPPNIGGVTTLGSRLGNGIKNGLMVWAAGKGFEELTGINIPDPILKGLAFAEGVLGAFGTSIAQVVAEAFTAAGPLMPGGSWGSMVMMLLGNPLTAAFAAAAALLVFPDETIGLINDITGQDPAEPLPGVTEDLTSVPGAGARLDVAPGSHVADEGGSGQYNVAGQRTGESTQAPFGQRITQWLQDMWESRSISKGLALGFGRENEVETVRAISSSWPASMGDDFAISLANLAKGFNVDTSEGALRAFGFDVVARRGLSRVPGTPSTPVPAIVHGGEMILNARDAASVRSGGMSGGINVTFNLSSASDREMVQMLRAQMPMIQQAVSDGIRRGARFGLTEFDQRLIRSNLQS